MPTKKPSERPEAIIVTTNAMTDMDIRKRLDHLGFTETAARLVQSLKPWAENGGIKAFAKEFYNRQFVNPDFVAIIRGNNSSQAVLEGAQADYAMDLFKGYPGAAYVNKRANIGKLHARINITPEWYIASYQFYYDLLYPMIRQQFSGEEESVRGGGRGRKQTIGLRPSGHHGHICGPPDGTTKRTDGPRGSPDRRYGGPNSRGDQPVVQRG